MGLTRPLVDGAAINIMENLTDAKRLHSFISWNIFHDKKEKKILENTAAVRVFFPLNAFSRLFNVELNCGVLRNKFDDSTRILTKELSKLVIKMLNKTRKTLR